MRQTPLAKYKGLLEAKQRELEFGLRRQDAIGGEKSAELLEVVQLAAEREVAIESWDLRSVLRRRVCSALRRIADGTYGVCLQCGERIPEKRLDAVPWAEYCVPCQQRNDTVGPDGGSHFPPRMVLTRAA